MPAVQSTYADQFAAGLPGLVANMEIANVITRACEEAAGIGFGLPVFQGVADRGILLADGATFAATGAAVAGNTGNGTITASPTTGAGVKSGVYRLTAVAATEFVIEDPDGINLGTFPTGSAAAPTGLGYTITAGGTPFAVGDQFTITVADSTGNGAFRGVSIIDKTILATDGGTADVYPENADCAVLTMGTIWVLLGETVTAGVQAYFNTATSRWTDNPAHRLIPNTTFDTSGGNGDVAIVRVSHL